MTEKKNLDLKSCLSGDKDGMTEPLKAHININV